MRWSPKRRRERPLPPLRTTQRKPDRIGTRPRIQPMGRRGEPWPNLCPQPPWVGMRVHGRPPADPRSCPRGWLTSGRLTRAATDVSQRIEVVRRRGLLDIEGLSVRVRLSPDRRAQLTSPTTARWHRRQFVLETLQSIESDCRLLHTDSLGLALHPP